MFRFYVGCDCVDNFVQQTSALFCNPPGSIPTEIGNLVTLENLYLASNSLTGELGSWVRCKLLLCVHWLPFAASARGVNGEKRNNQHSSMFGCGRTIFCQISSFGRAALGSLVRLDFSWVLSKTEALQAADNIIMFLAGKVRRWMATPRRMQRKSRA